MAHCTEIVLKHFLCLLNLKRETYQGTLSNLLFMYEPVVAQSPWLTTTEYLVPIKRWIKSLFSLWTFLTVESPNRVSLLMSMCVGLLSPEYLHCLPKRDTRTKLWHVVWYYFFVCNAELISTTRWGGFCGVCKHGNMFWDIKWQRHTRVWAFRKPKFMPEEK